MIGNDSPRSATFSINCTDVEGFVAIIQQVMALHSSGAVADFNVKGGAAERWRMRVVGTGDGIEAVATLVHRQPFLTAERICDWCLNAEAATVLANGVDKPEVTVGICSSCDETGLRESLMSMASAKSPLVAIESPHLGSCSRTGSCSPV